MFKNPKEDVSKKIMQLRLAALEALGVEAQDRCPTCMCTAERPFREHGPNGEITLGCVDAHHTEALEQLTPEIWATVRWHFRPDGVAVRQSWFDFLER